MIRLVLTTLALLPILLSAQVDLYRIRYSEEEPEGAVLRVFKGEAHFPHPVVFTRKVLTDYPRFKEFFPLMIESEVTKQPNQFRFKFRSRWPMPAFWALVEFEERAGPEGHSISFRRREGNVRELSGTVRIVEEKERKASGLFVEFRFDPGKLYPQWLVAKAAKPYLEEAMGSLGQHAALCHRDEIRKMRTAPAAAGAPNVK